MKPKCDDIRDSAVMVDLSLHSCSEATVLAQVRTRRGAQWVYHVQSGAESVHIRALAMMMPAVDTSALRPLCVHCGQARLDGEEPGVLACPVCGTPEGACWRCLADGAVVVGCTLHGGVGDCSGCVPR